MSINAQPFNPTFKLIGNLTEDQVLVYDSSENAFVNSAGSGGAGASGFTSAVNEGAGLGILSGTAGTTLQFKTLLGGDDITITDNGDALVITGTFDDTPQEGTNIGTGTAIFDSKDETTHTLKFKSLAVGAGLTLTDDGAGTLTLTNTASGGGGVAGADTTLSNLSDKSVARFNLDVYSKAEADTNYLKTDDHSIPSQDNTYDIGSPSRRYNDIYAETFQGIAVLADNLTIDGTVGQVLTYNGSSWVAADNTGGGGGGGAGVPQTLSLSGTDLTISGGNTVDLETISGSVAGLTSDSVNSVITLDAGWDLVPETDGLQSLGSASKRWTEVYIDDSTIHIGSNELEANANNDLLWNSNIVATQTWVTSQLPTDLNQLTDSTNLLSGGFSGDYDDLTNKPTIPTVPTNISAFTNDAGYITSAAVFSGDYDDLTNKPTLFDGEFASLSSLDTPVAGDDNKVLYYDHASTSFKWKASAAGFSGSYNDLTDKPTIPSTLADLTDVDSIDTPVTGDMLLHDGSEYKFVNLESEINDRINIRVPVLIGQSTIDDLSDVAVTSTQDGQFLVYNNVSGEWENQTVSLFDGDYNNLTNKPTLFDGNYSNLTNQPAIPVNLSDLTNVSSVAPADGQHLVWNNATGLWTPSAASTGGSSYSDTDARNSISATTGLSYNNSTGVMALNASISNLLDVSSGGVTNGQVLKWNSTTSVWEPGDDNVLSSTDALAEGSTNRYYTEAYFDASFGGKTTDQLVEGSNKYYDDSLVDARLQTQLVAGSNITITPGVGGQLTIASIGGSTYSDADARSALSLSTNSASGGGSMTYSSASGAFTYTPPDLSNFSTFDGAYASLTGTPTIPTKVSDLSNDSGFLTSVGTIDYNSLSNKPTLFSGAFSSLTGKPTTIAGYGITDAFDGDYNSLSNKPTLFSGAYASLTGTPTIPSDLTDLSISDGTSGQVLTTDGSGNFTFTTVSGGGGSSTLSGLTDTSVSNLQTYNFLQYDGSNWVNDYASIQHLEDVDSVDSPSSGDVLLWHAPNGQFEFENLDNKIDGRINTIGFSGDYDDLTNKPSLFDGDYNSLTNQPTIPAQNTAGTGIQINTGVVSLDASLSDLTNVVSTAATTGQVLKWNGTAWAPGSDNASASTAMNDITDTNISSPQDNDILYYDNANSQWKNQPLTSHVNFYDTTDFNTDFASKSITNLGDVNTNGITTGQYLEWNGTAFVPATPSSGGGASAINDLSDVDTNTSAPSNGDVLTWSASNSEWAPQAPASGGGGGGSNIEYFKLNYATNGNLTSITNATSGVSATILSATGGDVEISFSGTNYPPAGILIYGYARSTNEYVIMPLNKDITTRKVAGGGSAGSPIAFGSMGSVDLTLKMRESDTGASRSFGTDTHAWIMFTLI